MAEKNSPSIRLIVFSDDWGRHPSSCQHLMKHLMTDHAILWVNTIGTRRPKLSVEDLGKVVNKLKSWSSPDKSNESIEEGKESPDVINPLMYPGFRKQWQRQFNAARICKKVHESLGPRIPGETRIAITTLPITADLTRSLDVDRWIYYVVDDFSVWPGMDHEVMDRMERELVAEADQCIAVSENIQKRLQSMDVEAPLLTHGVDLDHWQPKIERVTKTPDLANEEPVRFLFWGMIDPRLDLEMLRCFAEHGLITLAGPENNPESALKDIPGIQLPGPLAYEQLPALAAQHDVLVMPYADLPVTRAMQPLKFKEYLATGKPIIARRLPAIQEWHDAACLVESVKEIPEAIKVCLNPEMMIPQLEARARLGAESWQSKAQQFREWLSEA